MVKNKGLIMPNQDDKEQFCPLCMEEFDLTDKSFHPCRCGYQVCIWCFHNIQDKLNGLCPACRSPYDKSSLNTLDPDLLAAAEADRKRKKEQQRVEKASAKAAAAAVAASAAEHKETRADRSVLQNVRVMQRNLVYVTGLLPAIAKEDILRRKDHFGRFGRIIKVAVNKKSSATTYSAYVTFKRNADASDCISHINSLVQESKSFLRATFGTTKYCSFFLRHVQCNNPGCLYLHELANESDCFAKEDLQHDFQLDEFDLDHHSHQNVSISDGQHSFNLLPTSSVSQQATDHARIHQDSLVEPDFASIPSNSQSSVYSNSPDVQVPVVSVFSDPGSLASDLNRLRNIDIVKGLEHSTNAMHNAAPSAFGAASGYSEARLCIPRPSNQSRRSFVIKDNENPSPGLILPGISALGLGKADSGPFGWDSHRNFESKGSQKATISPPDSPRTQQRVQQQKMFRSLLPNVDVSFIPHQNPRAQDFHPSPSTANPRQQSLFGHSFSNQPPLVIDKSPVASVIGSSTGNTEYRPPSWSQTFPSAPNVPARFDRYSRPPPPGLAIKGSHQSMSLPRSFDRHSPASGMAPFYDPQAPGMAPPRFGPHRSQSPAGLAAQGPASDDFRMLAQKYPPQPSSSNVPGLIQRPSMEPVSHINSTWFGL